MLHNGASTGGGRMLIEGSNGTITVDGECLRIRRKGLANLITQGFQGEKTIPFETIRAVQFKDAGGWMAGYIQFSISGAVERPAGIMEATKDENAVLFEKKQQPAFQQLRTLVEDRLTRSAPKSSPVSSIAADLERLGGLLERGLLTRDEFDQQKRALLAG